MNSKHIISVILADDEASIRNGLLSAIPWEVLDMKVMGVAKDGVEAKELIMALNPSIVITDIRMPHLSGLDLIQYCHEHQLDTHFIILSGYDDFSYAQTAIRYGARAYVLKPLKQEELVVELENLRDEIFEKHLAAQDTPAIDFTSFHALSKRMFFNQLINNEFHHCSDITNRLNELKIALPTSPFNILVITLKSNFMTVSQERIALAKDLLTSDPPLASVPIWENNKLDLCMYLSVTTEQTPQSVSDYCLQKLNGLPDCSVSIGIGTEENDWLLAGHSYHMALTALSYQLYEPNQLIFDQTIICTLAPTVTAGHMDNQKLIAAICKNERRLIESCCRVFFESLLYVLMPPPSFIRGMSIYFITDIQNALRKQVEDYTSPFSDLPYVTINQLNTLRQIVEWTTSLFLNYAETVSQSIASRRDHIILEAKQFIKERMHTKIHADEVASMVNLSPAYFTIYFKSKTGVNFRDYVLNLKMEHAKHLFETSSANISEVSYAVGYDDYRSFYRAFKNHTGMTPSEYQTNH